MRLLLVGLLFTLCQTSYSQFWIDSLEVTPIYVPNSFTSDNDLVNDAWKTYSDNKWDEFLVEVYNVWGECIWYSTDPEEWWFGQSNMEEPNYYALNGTYKYVVRARIGYDVIHKVGIINKLR